MTTQPPRPAFEELMPRFGELTRDILFGDIWERPGLSKRDRSLIVVAALTVLYRTDQLRGHIRRALENGLTKDELSEVFQHLAFYGGWPVAVNAFTVAKEVFDSQ
ncbi:MAG: carboxymuconolactone decarboxylase family protein [Chloroflexi bacterium]|nr:carboxymuconolactone decarboxylase family protein [Chloroflexota bacterium]MCI0769010.1 carboxymuconolactone decarboxylase family protein [Chloroflexota bacterium]